MKRSPRIYLNIWPKRRVSKAILNGGMFYVFTETYLGKIHYMMGHQDQFRRHEMAIEKLTYEALVGESRKLSGWHKPRAGNNQLIIMQIHLLVQPLMQPLPHDVHVNMSFGTIKVISHNDDNVPTVIEGEHMIVEGTAEAISNWLRPFDGFWLGQGPPQLQSFTISHIKDEVNV